MKYILAAILFSVLFSVNGQDNTDNIYVTAGPTLQGADSEAGVGFYLGLRTDLPVGDHFALGSLFSFVRQSYSVNDIDLAQSSMNASLFLSIKPVSVFSVNGGYQAGVNTSLKIADQSISSFERLRTGWLVGASFKASDKILIDGMFVRHTGQRIFDYTASLGIAYKF